MLTLAEILFIHNSKPTYSFNRKQGRCLLILFPVILVFLFANLTNIHASWNIELVSTDGEQSGASLALDSHGNPHIAYGGWTGLHYASWNGSTWNSEDVDLSRAAGSNCSLVLDANDRPHIGYDSGNTNDINNFYIKYASKKNGVWEIETIASQPTYGYVQIQNPCLALSSGGVPYITYFDIKEHAMGYATKDQSQWDVTYFRGDGSVGGSNSIKLDSNQKVHIAYSEGGLFDNNYRVGRAVYMAPDSIEWQQKEIPNNFRADNSGYYGIGRVSMAIDKLDKPHFVIDENGGALTYLGWNGIEWSTHIIITSQESPSKTSIAIDSNNHPHILFRDSTLTSLPNGQWQRNDRKPVYAELTATGWIVEILPDSCSLIGNIAVDGSGITHICYRDASGALKYAKGSPDTTPPQCFIKSTRMTLRTNVLPTISGTATDNDSGIDRVEVGISKYPFDNLTWSLATGTTTWSYSPSQLSDGDYRIFARAIDKAGNISSQVQGDDLRFLIASPPAVVWEKTFDSGENAFDWIAGIAVGPKSGNVYVSGTLFNQESSKPNLLLRKFNREGEIKWTKILSGSDNNSFFHAGKIALDSNENIYLVSREGRDYTTRYDLLISKYDRLGNFVKSVLVVTPRDDGSRGMDIKIGADGCIYVGAEMNSYPLGADNGQYGTVRKYDKDLNEIWVKNLPARGGTIKALWPDADGGVVSAGGSWQVPYTAQSVKLNSTGGEQWTHNYSAKLLSDNLFIDVVEDGNQNIYIAGQTKDDFYSGHPYKIIARKLTTLGDVSWTQMYNLSSNDSYTTAALTIDGANDLIIAGNYVSGSYYNGLLLKYSLDGVLLATASLTSPFGTTIGIMDTITSEDGGLLVAGSVGPTGQPTNLWLAKYDWADTHPFINPNPSKISNVIAVSTGHAFAISWQDSAEDDIVEYRVYTGTNAANMDHLATVSACPFFTQEIAKGVTQYYAIAAVDLADQVGALSNPVVCFIPPDIPPPDITPPGRVSGLAGEVSNSQIILNWQANPETDLAGYMVYRSTYSGEFRTVVATVTASSLTQGSLDRGVTYYYAVSAFDALGNEGLKSDPVSVFVERIKYLPKPPSDLVATPASQTSIRLGWVISPTVNVAEYRIYFSTGDLDFSHPAAVVSSLKNSYLFEGLAPGTEYSFVVRAANVDGEEQNTNIVSAKTLPPVPPDVCLEMSIKSPANGKKIGGERLMVMAEPVCSDPSGIKSVRFEFRLVDAKLWLPIPPADKNHPNPDDDSPYFVHWNLKNQADGTYQIRAIGMGVDREDTSGGYVTVHLDHADPDSFETVADDGVQQKTEKVFNYKVNVVTSDLNDGLVTVKLSSGAMTSDEVSMQVTVNPPNPPSPPSNTQSVAATVKIDLSNNQHNLENTAELRLPYKDDDNDGREDTTGMEVASLCIFHFNEGAQQWVSMPSHSDVARKEIIAETNHFSLFGLFALSSPSLAQPLIEPALPHADPTFRLGEVYAFPNPARAGKRPVIHFEAGIADRVQISLYDLSGMLVHDAVLIDPPIIFNSADGPKYAYEYSWDVSSVASGLYIYLIRATKNGVGNLKANGKVAVIK